MLIVIVVLVSIFVTPSFAQNYFEKNEFRLSKYPNICYLQPPNDSSFPKLDSQLYSQTQYAVTDWQTKLNQGLGKHPVWKMNLIYVSLDQFMGNKLDPSTCDILIAFLPYPTDQNQTNEPVGTTEFGFDSHKAVIKIYYLQLDFQRNVEETHDQNYVYHTYTWTPVYLKQIATDAQIGMAIRHELGHAFGLGHYIISDQEMQNWVKGIGEPTSIMIKTIMPIGYTHFDITPLDIKELKSVYGNNGFNSSISQIQTPLPETQTLIPQPQQSSNSQDLSKYYKNRFKSDLSFGTISPNTFGETMYYLEKNGEFNIPLNHKYLGYTSMPSWFKKTITWWIEDSITEKEFAVSMQYLFDNGILQF